MTSGSLAIPATIADVSKPSGRQSVGAVTHDFIGRTSVQDGHLGDPVEEPLNRRPTVAVRRDSDPSQPFLDGALQRRLHILAGPAGETSGEFVDFGKCDVHGATHQATEQRSILLQDCPIDEVGRDVETAYLDG